MIQKNQSVGFDQEVADELARNFAYPVVAIDTETTGNYPPKHALLEVACMDLFNPSLNFEGYCHIADGKVVSMKDIRKNQWGKKENFGKVINPLGNYAQVLDLRKEQDNDSSDYFLQPNNPGDFDLRHYDELSQIARGVLKRQKPVDGFIKTSAEDVLKAHYRWIREKVDGTRQLTHYRSYEDKPVVIPAGQNVAGFDVHYLNTNLNSMRIGKQQNFIMHRQDGTEIKISDFQPWQMQYRGPVDVGSELRAFIRYNVRPEDAADFWYGSDSAKGQKVPFPFIQGGTGETLDAAIEFVGLPRRPDPLRSGTPHVALDDVKLTVEVLARIYTGRQYLSEFTKHPVAHLVSRDYMRQELRRKAENGFA